MNDFSVLLSREYWTTQKGEKKFPHEFNDEHLANTIRFLHRSARRYRLEQARTMCNMIHRTGNLGADIDSYYRSYRKQMDDCLGTLDDKQWLKENAKIYNLLVEEAKYREVDFSDKPTKVKYTVNLDSRFSSTRSRFSYIFNA